MTQNYLPRAHPHPTPLHDDAATVLAKARAKATGIGSNGNVANGGTGNGGDGINGTVFTGTGAGGAGGAGNSIKGIGTGFGTGLGYDTGTGIGPVTTDSLARPEVGYDTASILGGSGTTSGTVCGIGPIIGSGTQSDSSKSATVTASGPGQGLGPGQGPAVSAQGVVNFGLINALRPPVDVLPG